MIMEGNGVKRVMVVKGSATPMRIRGPVKLEPMLSKVGPVKALEGAFNSRRGS